MANDIGVLFPNSFSDLHSALFSPIQPLFSVSPWPTPLGACFGPEILEERYRPHVVANFDQFLAERKSFNMLSKWRPEKLLALVTDGIAFRDVARETAEGERIDRWHFPIFTPLDRSKSCSVLDVRSGPSVIRNKWSNQSSEIHVWSLLLISERRRTSTYNLPRSEVIFHVLLGPIVRRENIKSLHVTTPLWDRCAIVRPIVRPMCLKL
jgi:hypothetical protein